MRKLNAAILSAALFASTSLVSNAQLSTGPWTQKTYVEKLHYHHTGGPSLEQIRPAPSSFEDDYVYYSKSSSTRTFRFKNTTAGRVEISVENHYTSGVRQFEGYVKFNTPSSHLSDWKQTYIFQDFGAADHAAWKIWIRPDGTLHCDGGYGAYVFASLNSGNVFGLERRINHIHNKSAGTMRTYINGSIKYDGRDDGGTTHYFKFGMYGGRVVTTTTWRNVKYFEK